MNTHGSTFSTSVFFYKLQGSFLTVLAEEIDFFSGCLIDMNSRSQGNGFVELNSH